LGEMEGLEASKVSEAAKEVPVGLETGSGREG
jgi:hypothetical protein